MKSRMSRIKRAKKNLGTGWAARQASKRSHRRPRRRSFMSNFRSVGYKAKK